MTNQLTRRGFLAASGFWAATPAFAQNYDSTIARQEPLPEVFAPKVVPIKGAAAAGELHVIPDHYSLYLTLGNDTALRYYVGVGKDGLYESGSFYVGAKKSWPGWTPTPEMIERSPKQYKQFEDGMPGGPNNPLGARAIYLFYKGRGDSFLRIHGTNRPKTIGFDVSNGCARLTNRQIVDLYNRVQLKSKVVLHPKGIYPKKPIWKVAEG